MAQSYLLTKSKYIHGLQCNRALWLDVFNPKLARYSAEQMRRFDHGREFEYSFKDTFPNGIDISAELKRNIEAYPALTAQLLEKDEETDLFEAGFLYNEVLVLADVVHRRPDGSLDVYEVKSGTTLSDTYRRAATPTVAMPPSSTMLYPIATQFTLSTSSTIPPQTNPSTQKTLITPKKDSP